MVSLEVKVVENRKELADALSIRHKVFTEEQGISEEADRDGKDKEAEHFISYIDSKPIGCARVRIIGNKAKWERIATLKDFRGKGYGIKMMKFLEEYSRKLDVEEIYFDAQLDAKGFYVKLGFEQKGEVFEEVGIPHVVMYKKLR